MTRMTDTSEVRCPLCHSDYVKEHRVCDKAGQWWSRCISGIDHGIIVTPEGREIDIGVDYDHIWFNDDGYFAYEVEGDNYHEGRVLQPDALSPAQELHRTNSGAFNIPTEELSYDY